MTLGKDEPAPLTLVDAKLSFEYTENEPNEQGDLGLVDGIVRGRMELLPVGSKK